MRAMIRKHRKYVDKLIAVLLIFVVPAIAVIIIDHNNLIPQGISGTSVSGTMLGVWGSMLGFMITAMSIIVSLGDGEFIKTIRGTPHFKTILFIITLTCIILFFAASFGAYVVCFNFWEDFCIRVFIYFLIGTGIAIFMSMVYLFYLILNTCNKND